MKYVLAVATIVMCGSFTGCTSGFSSMEAIAGTILGGGLGAGGSYLLDKDDSEKMALAGVAGMGIGAVAGAIMYENKVDAEQKAEVRIIRKESATAGYAQQKEIDALHKNIHDSTKWGQGETKHWDERYLGKESNVPYQGDVK